MSLEALAGLTGRSKAWLSKIENGHARLERRQDIAALAEALAVSADSLVDGEDIDYRALSDLLGEASGKGVLRAMHQKYSPPRSRR